MGTCIICSRYLKTSVYVASDRYSWQTHIATYEHKRIRSENALTRKACEIFIEENYVSSPVTTAPIVASFSGQACKLLSRSALHPEITNMQPEHTSSAPHRPSSNQNNEDKKLPPSSSQQHSCSNASGSSSSKDIFKDLYDMTSKITQEADTAIEQAKKDQEHIDKHGGGSKSYRNKHYRKH